MRALSNDVVKKTYIYANSQIIAQHDGDTDAEIYYYLHDRLGSVRQVIDTNGNVQNSDSFRPFGREHMADHGENISNPFRFTGQYYDSEIGEYYLRARQYDPTIQRFTARDPILGQFEVPLTLHAYLYCINDPVNKVDLDGRWAIAIGGSVTWNVGGLGSKIISKTIKDYGIIAGALVRNAIIADLASQITYSFGGTAGAGSVFGRGEEGWFFGSIFYTAGGLQFGKFVASATVDYAVSPNAQRLQDLAGGFIEVGGSAKYGVTVSRGINNDIYLITGSGGMDLGGKGGEIHGFVGYTWIYDWLEDKWYR